MLNSDTSTNPLFKNIKILEYFQEKENWSTWGLCVPMFGVTRHHAPSGHLPAPKSQRKFYT